MHLRRARGTEPYALSQCPRTRSELGCKGEVSGQFATDISPSGVRDLGTRLFPAQLGSTRFARWCCSGRLWDRNGVAVRSSGQSDVAIDAVSCRHFDGASILFFDRGGAGPVSTVVDMSRKTSPTSCNCAGRATSSTAITLRPSMSAMARTGSCRPRISRASSERCMARLRTPTS